jgi:small conductance mechanosensitive channel
MDQTLNYSQKALDWLWNYGPNIAISIALLFGGLWVIRRVSATLDGIMTARKVDDSLRPFFVSVADAGMKVMLLLVVAGRMGIETTSFIAIISALAFAIGLALQGSLGNFASGVLILLFRPYKVGDLVTIGGMTGDVREIQIFNTILETGSGKKIIIPNGIITSGAIENIAQHGNIRADIKIVFVDDTSISMVRAVSSEVIRRNEYILPEKEPFCAIIGFPGGGVEMNIGAWTTGENHDKVLEYMHEELKKAFDATGIKFAKDDKKITLGK